MEHENQLLQAVLGPYQVCSIHIYKQIKHFFRKRLLAVKILPPSLSPFLSSFFLTYCEHQRVILWSQVFFLSLHG